MAVKLKRNPKVPTSQIIILDAVSWRRLPQEFGQLGLALQSVLNLKLTQQTLKLSAKIVAIFNTFSVSVSLFARCHEKSPVWHPRVARCQHPQTP